MSNKLTIMAKEILQIEEDVMFRINWNEKPRPNINNFKLICFEQVWGSTACGFNIIGGCAMTEAMTYVLLPINCNQKAFVYFAGRYAYSADADNETFKKDLKNQNMLPVYKSSEYTNV